ncbi:MAG TPA: HTTM domain-containing protein [Gemmataceae bacterium]|nr:HTTM domain-containing protein [Gemmataceae bacterium]
MSAVSDDRGAAAGAWSRLAKTFFGLDLRSLALFRIGLALVLLADLADRWPYLAAHYTDDGVLPRGLVPIYVPVSLHALGGSTAYEQLLFVLAGAVAVALLVGYRTQPATLVSWLLLLSLHARNPLVLHGGDLMLRLLLFWSIFLPLGACWSVDARRAAETTPPARPLVSSVATLALLLQAVFVYWFGLAARTDPAWWGDATAVPYALNLDFYATSLGVWARGLPPEMLRAATVATVAIEGGGPLLLLLSGGLGRLRSIVVALMIAFHVLLGLAMRLGTFPLVCVVAWLPFLPAWFWDDLVPRLGRFVSRRSATDPAKPAEAATAAPASLSPLATGVVVLCLAYVCLCNVLALQEEGGGFILARIKGIGIDQAWGMFAPFPNREDGWYVVEARLQNGTTVDPFRGGPVIWEKPPRISALYPSIRWAAYLSLLRRDEYDLYRPYFANYLGHRWNTEHVGGETAESVEVYYMLRFIQPDYTATEPKKRLLVRLQREPDAGR